MVAYAEPEVQVPIRARRVVQRHREAHVDQGVHAPDLPHAIAGRVRSAAFVAVARWAAQGLTLGITAGIRYVTASCVVRLLVAHLSTPLLVDESLHRRRTECRPVDLHMP